MSFFRDIAADNNARVLAGILAAEEARKAREAAATVRNTVSLPPRPTETDISGLLGAPAMTISAPPSPVFTFPQYQTLPPSVAAPIDDYPDERRTEESVASEDGRGNGSKASDWRKWDEKRPSKIKKRKRKTKGKAR